MKGIGCCQLGQQFLLLSLVVKDFCFLFPVGRQLIKQGKCGHGHSYCYFTCCRMKIAFFITKKQCVNRTELTAWQQISPACWAIGETNPKKASGVEKALCGQSVQRGTGTAGEDENEAFKDSKLLGVPGKAVALHADKLQLLKRNLCGPVRRNVSLKIFESEFLKVFWAVFGCSL